MNQNEFDPAGQDNGKGGRHAKPVEKKKGRAGKTILIVVVAVVLVVFLAGFLVFRNLYNKIGTGSHADSTGVKTTETAGTTPAPTEEPTPSPTPEPLTEEEIAKQEELALMASLQQDAEEILCSDDVYNILLLGADGRSEEVERSDAMILLSINERTETIWLTSFMRDTEVWIADWGTGHLNWSTSFGGVEMLIDTLESEQNFAIHIDNWAMVNFVDFIEVADLLGPVTVTVTEEEMWDIDPTIREACQVYDAMYGLEGDDCYPRSYFYNFWYYEDDAAMEEATDKYNLVYDEEDNTVTGTITNGAQILGYCRERHIGGDTGRSEKQRDVLMQFWGNVKKMSLKEMYSLAEKVMSIVKTDISMGKCASLMLKVPQLLNYTIHTQQCPTPGSFWKGRDVNGLSIYNADFQTNRNFLRATIYGEEMTAADLTSYWTGEAVLIYDPEG